MLHDVGNNRDCDVDVDHRNNTNVPVPVFMLATRFGMGTVPVINLIVSLCVGSQRASNNT